MADRPRARVETRRRRSRSWWVVRLVPPFVALLFAEALLYIAAVRANDTGDFFSPSHWARWDSGIYLSIAAHGYTDTPCPAGLFPPHTVCGSVGWAPLYPGLMSLLGHVGLTLPVAGMTLSILFTFLTLGAAWILIGPSFSASRLLCLAFAACFPGMIYYFAIFPISLFTFFALLSLIFFIRKHYVLAGLAGAVCCWAFYSGPLIIGVLVVAAILVERGPQIWKVVAQSAGIAARRVRRPPRRQPLVGRELDGLSLGAGEVRQRPAQPRGDVHCRLHREPAGPVHDPGPEHRVHPYLPSGADGVRRPARDRSDRLDAAAGSGQPGRLGDPELHGVVLVGAARRRHPALPLPHRGVADPVCPCCARGSLAWCRWC